MWKKQILAVLILLLIPWLGTLLWMQIEGETAPGGGYGEGARAAWLGEMELENLRAGSTGDAGAGSGAGNAGAGSSAGNAGAGSSAGNAGADSSAGNPGAGSSTGNPGADSGGERVGNGGGQVAEEAGGGGTGGEANGADAVFAEEGHASHERRIVMERRGVETYLDLEAYLPGVIVCQIPEKTEYHMEVWKCQAIIARTYICRLMEGRSEIHEEELDMDYLGENGFSWGKMDDALVRRLEQAEEAVKETEGMVMKYEDRYILPLFHEMSAGRTRNGQEEFPYLQSADSRADAKRENYLQVMEWPKSEFASRISQIPDAAQVTPDQLPQEIQTVEKDDAGYLLQMKIGARIYTGDEIRYALGLPSACFSLEGDDTMIRARVRGRGHGYGLSQAGADTMAAEGWSCNEILQHYYKNISLISE